MDSNAILINLPFLALSLFQVPSFAITYLLVIYIGQNQGILYTFFTKKEETVHHLYCL